MKDIKAKNQAEREIMKRNLTQKGYYGESLEDIIYSKHASYEEKSKAHSALRTLNERDIERHRNAVRDYKKAWNAKKPLWKLFHLKYSPKRTPLDSMDSIRIERKAKKISSEYASSRALRPLNERDIERHRNAVRDYKKAWNAKNPLWKLFHLKYSPKRTPLDSMDSIRIERKAKSLK